MNGVEIWLCEIFAFRGKMEKEEEEVGKTLVI